jgi:hypothetical protein
VVSNPTGGALNLLLISQHNALGLVLICTFDAT